MIEPQYHLAIDGNEANVTHRVGSNVYAFELINALSELWRNDRRIQVTVLLSDHPTKDLPRTRKYWRYKVVTPKKFWTQWGLPIHLYLNADVYDVFFTPGHYAPRVSAVPYVSSVMDLAFLAFPDQFKKSDLVQLTNWTAYSVKHAKKVVAISNYTKFDIVKRYGKNENDIVVAPPAVNPPTYIPTSKDGAQVTKKFGITDPYIIHIGTIQPRKNIERLIEAFESVSRHLASSSLTTHSKQSSRYPKRYQLVLVGKVGWLAKPIMDRIKNSPFANQIVVTGFVTDEEKQALLTFAQCSAHLGLYEGFGIPALESLHAGTIPLVSSETSLPEVVGSAGILVNPYETTQITKALEFTLALKAREKAKLRKAARNQLHTFSWHQSAQVVADSLLTIAQQRSKKSNS
jgi:glycosyltransferase involved in cell wall biosynthesis